LPPEAQLRRADVVDGAIVREMVTGASVVYHLAAVASVVRSNERWLESHITNSAGIVAVMAAIRDVAPTAVVVYASSAAVYGNLALAEGERVDENIAPRPLGPYGADKLATELQARVGGSLFHVRSCGLRFFNVYGHGQAPESPYSGVITRFVARARAGGPITIFGDGRQSRDFVHVNDVIASLLLAESAASTEAPVINICTGVPTSIERLASLVGSLAEPRPAIVYGPAQPGDIRHTLGDPGLAARLLGWRAQVPLHEGLTALMTPPAIAEAIVLP
jgi:UDP-glucose 4-epimerase